MCINFRFARGTEGLCFGGNYKAGRTNEGGKDLNRDFPSHKEKGQPIDELKLGRQMETQIMIDFILNHPFVLSANFHDGAVLANYPYDDYRTGKERTEGIISRTPDHDVFYHLATTYSFNHAFMNDTSKECPYWGYFKDGVTNGAGNFYFAYLVLTKLEVLSLRACTASGMKIYFIIFAKDRLPKRPPTY